jgi:hypothetical protein
MGVPKGGRPRIQRSVPEEARELSVSAVSKQDRPAFYAMGPLPAGKTARRRS